MVAIGFWDAVNSPHPSSNPPEMNKKAISTVDALDTAPNAYRSINRPIIMVSATV